MTKIRKKASLILALFLTLFLLYACATYQKPVLEPLNYNTFTYTSQPLSKPPDIVVGALKPTTSVKSHHVRDEAARKSNWELRAVGDAYTSALERMDEASVVLSQFEKGVQDGLNKLLESQKSFASLALMKLAERRDTLLVVSPGIDLSITTTEDKTNFAGLGSRKGARGKVHRLQQKLSVEGRLAFTIYEPLTETELLRWDGEAKKSEDTSFFSDIAIVVGSWAEKYKFLSIEASTYPHALTETLSNIYLELIRATLNPLAPEKLQALASQARLIREEAVPSFPSPSYRFVYEAPSQETQSTGIVAAVIEFEPLVKLQVVGSEPARIAKEFAEAVQKNFSSVLHVRRVQVLQQSIKNIDDMVYADKKSAYFVLTPEIALSLTSKSTTSTKQIGPISTSDGSITLTGTFSISLVEPFSKQKLLFKQIYIPSMTESITIVEYQKGGEEATLADSKTNAVAKLLETAYQQIFGELFQTLNYKDLANLKSQVNEIRGKLGFPALP